MPPGNRPPVGARVGDLGELRLLDRIAARARPGEGVVLGIGDDTAAVRLTPGRLALFTTDALVEDVHFRHATSAAADVGWKALAINVSDIAAMGGIPRHAVVSLMLPAHLEAAWVDGLYDGLLVMAAASGVTVVGGNLAQAPAVIVDLALLGEVEPDRLVSRGGARPGDVLAVTGTLGRAAAGLVALQVALRSADSELVARAVAAQRRPQPRVTVGRALAASGAARAMIDLSDGLALDLWRLCEASGVGARIDTPRLPVDPCVDAVAEATGRDALTLATTGGEDYELLVALSADAAAHVARSVEHETGIPVSIIGQIEPREAGCRMFVEGVSRTLEPGGWTHFRLGQDR